MIRTHGDLPAAVAERDLAATLARWLAIHPRTAARFLEERSRPLAVTIRGRRYVMADDLRNWVTDFMSEGGTS